MQAFLRRLFAFTSPWVSNGYRAVEVPIEQVGILLPTESDATVTTGSELKDWLSHRVEGGAAFVLPSYVSRTTDTEFVEIVEAFLAQMRAAVCNCREVKTIAIIGLQWDNLSERDVAQTRLRRAILRMKDCGVPCLGLTLKGRQKSRTLNAVFEFLAKTSCRAVGWIDDDVTLEPNCVAKLIRSHFDRCFRGAVGATKVGWPRRNKSSKLLFAAKEATRPACNYPHGCCILVEFGVVANGIPPQYATSDDGFVCFSLLDPKHANPLHSLYLVPDAKCHHFVGGRPRQLVGRINRLLTNHHVFMAGFGIDKAVYYFRHMLFFGLWPIGAWDHQLDWRSALLKWGLKCLYLVWFTFVGVNLFVRGVFGVPKRQVSWSGVNDADRPAV